MLTDPRHRCRSSILGLGRASLLFLLGLGGSARGEAYYPDLLLSGACNEKNFLNGLVFERKGTTRSGAPYYKATTAEEYIYYDPDCSGGGDGSGRWILDEHSPSTTALNDLDGDGVCDYHARIDSPLTTRPPLASYWRMSSCANGDEAFVTLADITTTSTTTSGTTTLTSTTKSSTSTVTTKTSTTSTSRTRTSTTRSTTTGTSTVTTRTGTSTSSATSTTRTYSSTTSSTLSSTMTATLTMTTTATGTQTVTTTGTSTVTSSTVTSKTGTTTITGSSTSTQTLTTTWYLALELGGACAFKDFLNGLTFKTQGVTASGAPYFKAEGAEHYMYHDLDCNGVDNGTARWVIDSDAPNASLTKDLDQDGSCNYHARIDSNDTMQPPAHGNWTVFCGSEWMAQHLHLHMVVLDAEVPKSSDTSNASNISNASTASNTSNASDAPNASAETTTAEPTRPSLSFALSGDFCPGKEWLNGMEFDLAGTTGNGSTAFFRSREHKQYIYYDPSCSGSPNGAARWVIDSDRPSKKAENDLDRDSACSYHARVDSDDASYPPKAAMWRVDCNSSWQDSLITLTQASVILATEVPTTTVPVHAVPVDPDATNLTESVNASGSDEGTVSSARGLQWQSVAVFLHIFALMYRLGQ